MLQDGFVEVNGIKLHSTGNGKGMQAIFQQGFGQSWRRS